MTFGEAVVTVLIIFVSAGIGGIILLILTNIGSVLEWAMEESPVIGFILTFVVLLLMCSLCMWVAGNIFK